MPIPKIVVTAALMAANMAMTMTRKIEGPRLDDLKFTGGDYGVPLALVWGMRRMQAPIFWAEDLQEVKRRRKTKGGKFNEYTYYGTWAVALAGHEIEAVRRIWFDTHLVYDVSGAGPVTPFDFGGSIANIDDVISIYLGTETQTPDPRMEATVEAEFGEGSCPAYRGTAYIVFKDIPLEKIGNRIPQVSVELVGNVAANYPMDETLSTVYGLTGWRLFSPDYSLLLLPNTVSGAFSVFDVAARTEIASGTASWDNVPHIRNDGNILSKNNNTLAIYDLFGNFLSTFHDFSPSSPGALVGLVYDGGGTEHRLLGPASGDGAFWFDEVQFNLTTLIGETGSIYGVFADLDGNIWGVGKAANSATQAFFYRFVTVSSDLPEWFSVDGLPSYTGISDIGPACHYRDGSVDHFVFQWQDDLYAANTADGSVSFSQTAIEATTYLDAALLNLPVGATSIWVGHEEFNLADLTKIREVALSNWDSGYSDAGSGLYDPVNHALTLSSDNIAGQAWLYLDRVGSGGVALSTICGDVADLCDIDGYDFSDLDQTIEGWSATRGPASNMIEPLLDAYDSDFRPHDFTIEGLKRTGSTSGDTLLTEYFVGEPRYTVKVRQSSELPRAVIIDFADLDAEQQPNSVRSDRPLDATDARSEKKIDLTTLALDVDEARGLSDRHFRRIWNERKEIGLSLTAHNLALEPGDVRTLSLDGEELDARCVRITVQSSDVIETEWRYDHPSLAALDGASGAAFDGRNDQTIAVPLLSKGFVLDIPLIEDADEASVPQLYVAAAPYASGTWPGAVIYENVDGEYSEELASIPSSARATWGIATEALGDANPWVWDRGNTVNVNCPGGTLAGTTEAAIDANPETNLALLGDEIINFTTATLEADGTYTLSGLKRGRRGTEWATGTHAVGDAFVLLDDAITANMGLSDVGSSFQYKAITSGRTEAGATVIDVSFTGATMKPYAPAHLSAVKESNGDWTIDAIRRTRVGGAWVGGTTIPLGEDSESYSITLSDGATEVTKTTSSLPYTWTSAAQTTDTGAEVTAGNLEYSIAQVSAQVGNGFVSEATA